MPDPKRRRTAPKPRRKSPRKVIPPEEHRRNIVYGSTWQKVRRTILERDGHRCQVKGPGCKGHADRVDHIVDPLRHGGSPYEPSNLRASCGSCNIWRIKNEGVDGTPASERTPCPHVLPDGRWCFEAHLPTHWSRAWLQPEVAVRLFEEELADLGAKASPVRRHELAKAKAKLRGPQLA